MNTSLLGRWGESLVAEELRRRGCRVVASGYRTRFGEIDLIAEDGPYLLFVEVKLRKSDRFALAGPLSTGANRSASAPRRRFIWLRTPRNASPGLTWRRSTHPRGRLRLSHRSSILRTHF